MIRGRYIRRFAPRMGPAELAPRRFALGISMLGGLILTVVAAPADAAQTAGTVFRCPGAAFQLPIIDGYIGWLYLDKRSTDPSGLHTGIDIYPPTKDTAVPVYPLADGFLREVNAGHNSTEVFYPAKGVTSYMAHINLAPGLKDGNPVYANQPFATLLIQPGNTHLHFSLKVTGQAAHYNDQQPPLTPGAAEDPSDLFNANLKDPDGSSNPADVSSYPPYKRSFESFCRLPPPNPPAGRDETPPLQRRFREQTDALQRRVEQWAQEQQRRLERELQAWLERQSREIARQADRALRETCGAGLIVFPLVGFVALEWLRRKEHR